MTVLEAKDSSPKLYLDLLQVRQIVAESARNTTKPIASVIPILES